MLRLIQIIGALAVFSLTWVHLWWQQNAIVQASESHNDGIPIVQAPESKHYFSSSLLPSAASAASSNDGPTIPKVAFDVKEEEFVGHKESQHATVIGVATGYDTRGDFRPFVGSLRKSGYSGAIILAVDEDIPERVTKYLKKKNVTTKLIQYTNCSFPPIYQTQEELQAETDETTLQALTICAKSHPEIKLRWLKYPAAMDWLRDCPQCTGPVLFTDVRDVFFQDDPFGPGAPKVTGLQVFEEHRDVTTNHWLVDWPLKECKGNGLGNTPMLCSGSTIGTREAMMSYLDTMYQEMKQWLDDPKCRLKLPGGDQAIHNYLFYNGKLSDAKVFRNREGSVHTVGFEMDQIWQQHLDMLQKEKGTTKDQAKKVRLSGANEQTWISKEKYRMTDDFGFFTNYDGSRSRVVHQWDRAKRALEDWMEQHDFL